MKKKGKRIVAYVMLAVLLTTFLPAENLLAEERVSNTESTEIELRQEDSTTESEEATREDSTTEETKEEDSATDELTQEDSITESEEATQEDKTTENLLPEEVMTGESEEGLVTEEAGQKENEQKTQDGVSENQYTLSTEKKVEVRVNTNDITSNMLRMYNQGETKAIKMPNQAICFDNVYNDTFRGIPSEQNNGLYYYNNNKIYFYNMEDNTFREVYSYPQENTSIVSVYPDLENSKFYILRSERDRENIKQLVDEFNTATEAVESTKDFTKVLVDDKTSSEIPSAIGVDYNNRYYLAAYNLTTKTYFIHLISQNLEELSKVECENEIYEFSGFDQTNGNFYFEGYINWVYWGYDHNMQSLKCGNVSDNEITISDLYMDLLYQQGYTPHYDNAVMLMNGDLVWTSTAYGVVRVLESNKFDITGDTLPIKGSVSRAGYEEENKFAQSVGTRVVYNSQTDGIVMYVNDNLIVEFDSDFNQRSCYRTEYPVFAMYNYGDQIMVIEKDSESNYYIEVLNWAMPSNFTLSQTSKTIKVGESFSLSAIIDSGVEYSYTWSSNNNSVASVTEDGKVFANKAGTAMISAQLVNGAKAECTVTVQKVNNPTIEGELNPGGESSENISENDYSTWASIVKSNLTENEDKTLSRVESTSKGVIVEKYSSDGKKLLSSKVIKNELEIFGGYFSGTNNNYLVFGQKNTKEDDKNEVMRIVKYSKEWEKINDCKIYGANTAVPFSAGSLRMIELDGKLYVYTCHEMYADSNGTNHQANMLFMIDENTMKITDSMYDVSNLQDGYVSHSFNQFIKTDGTYIYRVDHSESNNVVMGNQCLSVNGITLTMYDKNNESTNVITSIPVKFDIHNGNYTGASIGGFEIGCGKCLIAYSQDISQNTRCRNIYISVTDKYFNNSKTVALTNYKKDKAVTCRTPQMIKINENLFLVMWEESDLSTGKVVTKAMTIDSSAKTVSDAITLSYRLSDCQPVFCRDGSVKWYVTDNTSPKIYSINPYELSMPNTVGNLRASAYGKNSVLLTWTKSAVADGYLIYAQKNKKYGYCGMTSKTSYIDTKALDTDYNFYWIYPYVMGADGKRIVGKSPAYVYAKGICVSVTNLKAANQKGSVKLTWTKSSGADGYLIYGKTSSGKYGYIGMTSKTNYIDKKASKTEWNFYWVFPYHRDVNGKRVVGQKSSKYVYGKAK